MAEHTEDKMEPVNIIGPKGVIEESFLLIPGVNFLRLIPNHKDKSVDMNHAEVQKFITYGQQWLEENPPRPPILKGLRGLDWGQGGDVMRDNLINHLDKERLVVVPKYMDEKLSNVLYSHGICTKNGTRITGWQAALAAWEEQD